MGAVRGSSGISGVLVRWAIIAGAVALYFGEVVGGQVHAVEADEPHAAQETTRPFPEWLPSSAGAPTAPEAAPSTKAPLGMSPFGGQALAHLVGNDVAAELAGALGATPDQGIVGSDNDVLRVTTTKGPCGPSLTFTHGEQAHFRFESSQAGPLSIYYPSSRGETHVRTIDLPANTVYRYSPNIDATNGGTRMYVRLIQPGNRAHAYCAFTVEAAASSTLCAWATYMFEDCGDAFYELELESCATGRTYWYAGELQTSAGDAAMPSEGSKTPSGASATAAAGTRSIVSLWSFDNPRVAWDPECYTYVLSGYSRARLIGSPPNVSCADCPSTSDRGGTINVWMERGSFYQCDGVFQQGEVMKVFVRAGQTGPATLYVHHSDNTRTVFELGQLVAGITYSGDFLIDDDPPGRQVMYVQQTALRALDTCSYIVDVPRMCSAEGGMTVRTLPETPIAHEPFTILVSGVALNGCVPGPLSWRMQNGTIELSLDWGGCNRSCAGGPVAWDREIEVPGLFADVYPTTISLTCDGRSEMCDDGIITVVDPPKPVFVLLPGIAGSKLENSNSNILRHGEAWPNIGELLVGRADSSLLGLYLTGLDTLLLQPNGVRAQTSADVIRATDPLWTTPINKDYYDTLRYRILDEAWGTLVPCPYDWRLAVDSAVTMSKVSECVDTARSAALGRAATNEIASPVPGNPVVLLGHSLGGIVARAYIADPARAANVDRVISVGTPYLGAPVMLSRLTTGYTGIGAMDGSASVTRKVRDVYRNAPTFQYLLPSSDYGGSPLLSDGGTPVSFANQPNLLRQFDRNVELIGQARALHRELDDMGRDVHVPVHILASRAHSNTPFAINVRTVKRRSGGVSKVWETRSKVHGDGTVPLVSAMANPTRADVYRPGAAHVCVFSKAALADGKSHGELMADDHVIDDIVRLASGNGPEHCQTIHAGAGVGGDVDASSADAELEAMAAAQADVPSYEVDIVGTESVLAEDVASGAKLGIDPEGTVHDSWSGAQLYATPEGIVRVAFSDEDRAGPVSIEFAPEGGTGQEITIRRYTAATGDEQTVEQRMRFIDLDSVQAGDRYRLWIPREPGEPSHIDVLDAGGDVIRTIEPSYVLRGAAAVDIDPPTIDFDVTLDPRVRVTVIATDTASGVEELLVSLDGGTVWEAYSGPIVVRPGSVGVIQAIATDRAGNTSWPPAIFAVPTPAQQDVYLPMAIHGHAVR